MPSGGLLLITERENPLHMLTCSPTMAISAVLEKNNLLRG